MRPFTILLLLGALAGCTKTAPPAQAFRIEGRTQLIGGKRALAEVGDYKLTNGIIHAIIQDKGYSRGFGAFGGSLIDIDLVRSGAGNAASGVAGNDYFTEMFPAYFLEALEPEKVEVLNDGKDGQAAIIRVTGGGGAFVSLTKPINDLVLPTTPLIFTCDYILEPGKHYLKIVSTLKNPEKLTADGRAPVREGDVGIVPAPTAQFPLRIPFGFVTLLGEGQKLFVPSGAGFDMRFWLEDVTYKRNAALESLPGEVVPFWSTAGDGVSYALAPGRTRGGNYTQQAPTYYPTADKDSMLIPIAYSSFLGSYWAKSPPELVPGQSLSYTGYLAVGSGDVASAQKVLFDIEDSEPVGDKFFKLREKLPYGTLSGTVREQKTNLPLAGVSVVLQRDDGEFASQAETLANGVWTASVAPGKYRAYAVQKTRSVVVSDYAEVAEGGKARLDFQLEQPGTLQVIIRDATGRALPAKVSVEARYDSDGTRLPRQFLYNLNVGERYRVSDLDKDTPSDPDSRRYLEKVEFAPHGTAGLHLRPGSYTVWASRGMEYDLQKQDVVIKPGQTEVAAFTLTHVLPTPGWASADFHVHSLKSVDSDMEQDERVASFVAEGVDFLSSTDHNYVADHQPTIEALQLSDWLRSTVGLELTSLEMGHFNAFPLKLAPGPVQHGSFRWFYRPPGELFAQLRGLGADPQQVVVQVNHPRDTIMGYLNAFNVGTYVGKPIPAASSFALDTTPQADGSPSPYDPVNYSEDFDALEIFNGKRTEVLFNYRLPAAAQAPPGPEPSLPACPPAGPTTETCLPAAGRVLEDVIKVETTGQPTQYLTTPAFPGAQDDWFTFLSQGKRYVATGNSDSHTAKSEAGLPRNYIHVGASADGSMRALDEKALFAAMRAGDVMVTNGPIVEFTLNGQGLGRTVVAPSGTVDFKVTVKAAPWVDVTRVVVRRGGPDRQAQKYEPEVLDDFPVPASTEIERFTRTETYTQVPDDSFFVVEVFGDKPMWPVFTPHEFASIQLSDAVAVLGGSFGFGSKFGKYRPSQEIKVTPYAFTNPIYVTRTAKQALTRLKPVLAPSSGEPKPHTPVRLDLIRLFGQFHDDLD